MPVERLASAELELLEEALEALELVAGPCLEEREALEEAEAVVGGAGLHFLEEPLKVFRGVDGHVQVRVAHGRVLPEMGGVRAEEVAWTGFLVFGQEVG